MPPLISTARRFAATAASANTSGYSVYFPIAGATGAGIFKIGFEP
jgi:hypothetical protein